MKSKKVLLGFLAGLSAGAILGILFAPGKGSETREKIKTKSKEYFDDLAEKVNDFPESLKDKYDALKEEAKNIIKEKVKSEGKSQKK
jgi:gas vesicle protein